MTDKSYHKNDPSLYYSKDKICSSGVKKGFYQLAKDDVSDDDCYSHINSELCDDSHVDITVEQKSFFENKIKKILPNQFFLGEPRFISEESTYLPSKEDCKKITHFKNNFRMNHSMNRQFNQLNGIPSAIDMLFKGITSLNNPDIVKDMGIEKYGNFNKPLGQFYFESMDFEKIDDSIKNWVEYIDDTNTLWDHMGEYKLTFDNNRTILKSCNKELFSKNEKIWKNTLEEVLEIINDSNYLIHQFSKHANNCDYPKFKELLDEKNILSFNKNFLQVKMINKQYNSNIKSSIKNSMNVTRFLVNYKVNTAPLKDCLEDVDENIAKPLINFLDKFENYVIHPKAMFAEITVASSSCYEIPTTLLYIGSPKINMRYDENGVSKVNLIEKTDVDGKIITPIELPIYELSSFGSIVPKMPNYSLVFANTGFKQGAKILVDKINPLNKFYKIPSIYAMVNLPNNAYVTSIRINSNNGSCEEVKVYEAFINNPKTFLKGCGVINETICISDQFKIYTSPLNDKQLSGSLSSNYLLIEIDNIDSENTTILGGEIEIKDFIN